MAKYYLVGNLRDDQDLWLINKEVGKAFPIPKEAWRDMIAAFHTSDADRGTAGNDLRLNLAQSVLDVAEHASPIARNVNLALATDDLGIDVETIRFTPLDELFQADAALAAAVLPSRSLNIAAALTDSWEV